MLACKLWLLLSYALPLLPFGGWRELDAKSRPSFDRLRCIQGSLEVKVEPATEKEAIVTVNTEATFAPTHLEEIEVPFLETARWVNLATGRDHFIEIGRPTIRMPALEGTSSGLRSGCIRRLPPGRYLIRAQFEAVPAGRWQPLWTGTAMAEVAPGLSREQAINQLAKLAADDAFDEELTEAVQNVLWRTCLDEGIFNAVGQIGALRKLDLADLNVTDDSLMQLGNLADLQRLSLTRTLVSGTAFSALSGMASLRELDLSECRLAPGALAALVKAAPSIKILRLSKATFAPDDVRSLAGLHRLREADLSYCRLPAGWAASLTDLDELQNINLSHAAVTDADVRALSRLRSLTSVSLKHTSATDHGISLLIDQNRLHTLYLGGTRVTTDGLRKAARMPSLKYISVSGNDDLETALARLGLTVIVNRAE